jgi:hypothetical protein
MQRRICLKWYRVPAYSYVPKKLSSRANLEITFLLQSKLKVISIRLSVPFGKTWILNAVIFAVSKNEQIALIRNVNSIPRTFTYTLDSRGKKNWSFLFLEHCTTLSLYPHPSPLFSNEKVGNWFYFSLLLSQWPSSEVNQIEKY